MRHAEVDQARLFAAGNDFHLMVDDLFGAANEGGAVARLAQGVGTDDAYRALGQVVDHLREAAQAVQATLHGGLVEQAVLVDAGSQLHLFAESFEDAHFTVAGAREHHVKTVRAQIQGGDHGKGFSGVLAHWAVSMQNPDILTRSTPSANAVIAPAACSGRALVGRRPVCSFRSARSRAMMAAFPFRPWRKSMSDYINNVSDSSFEQDVLQADGPVLVDYWAEWCGPCKMIAPVLDEIAKDYEGRLKVCKLNIDENQETPPKYGVRGIPTLMLFKNGNVEATKVGALSKSQLAAFLDSNI